MSALELYTIITTVNTILVGICSGLTAAYFLRRGPKGDQGCTGYPGPPGMAGKCDCEAKRQQQLQEERAAFNAAIERELEKQRAAQRR